jgi:hypothetical protein
MKELVYVQRTNDTNAFQKILDNADDTYEKTVTFLRCNHFNNMLSSNVHSSHRRALEQLL